MALDGETPGRNEIRVEMESIFRTPEFERAPVMRRLLEFLVAETLAGRGDTLKAYSVAVDGLGRDPDFDSQSDSYPRVQVGRLRKMLDAHYARAPAKTGIRLDVKPGAYRVDFAERSENADVTRPEQADTPSAQADHGMLGRSDPPHRPIPWRLTLAAVALLATLGVLIWIVLNARGTTAPPRTTAQAPVLEIGRISASGGAKAQLLSNATRFLLDDALHRSWLIRVRQEARVPLADLAEEEVPVYRLTGHVDTTGLMDGPQVTFTLRDVGSGNQLWSQTIAAPGQGVTLSSALTPAIASLIGPFGVIATHQRGLTHPAERPGYACLLDYDSYFRYRDPRQRVHVRTCVAETVDREPMSPPALAAASFLSVDPLSGGERTGARERASDYARRAVAANANSAEAQAADARVAFINGQCTRGGMIADRAVRLNPYNAEIMGLMGFLLFQCDDPRAITLLRDALALDPDVPPFYSAAYILALLEAGQKDQAILMADTIRPPGTGMSGQYEITQVIAASAKGDVATARAHWANAARISRTTVDNPDRVLARYFFSPPFRAKVIRHLVASGVVVPAR